MQGIQPSNWMAGHLATIPEGVSPVAHAVSKSCVPSRSPLSLRPCVSVSLPERDGIILAITLHCYLTGAERALHGNPFEFLTLHFDMHLCSEIDGSALHRGPVDRVHFQFVRRSSTASLVRSSTFYIVVLINLS